MENKLKELSTVYENLNNEIDSFKSDTITTLNELETKLTPLLGHFLINDKIKLYHETLSLLAAVKFNLSNIEKI